jgi:UDP-glucuronate 4-epimerase
MRIFVTGTAGFIGFHVAERMLQEGHEVVGFDGMTAYYDVALKHRRHFMLKQYTSFRAVEAMLEDKAVLDETIAQFEPEIIVHLAAQAGVRYSIEDPQAYIGSNLVGTFNILEAARALSPHHLLIASTSSVYGANDKVPFEETDRSDFPVSLYAATKKAGEAMSHSYAHLFKIPTTCFRFFTVYGPWGRPDMALFKFVAAIERGMPIDVYGEGKMRRDFTYIDDLVEAIARLMHSPPTQGHPVNVSGLVDSLSPVAPWRVVNIAGGHSVGLMPFIDAIEKVLGKSASKNMLPMQQGDVPQTFADARLLEALTGFLPSIGVEEGVKRFIEWYRSYHQS